MTPIDWAFGIADGLLIVWMLADSIHGSTWIIITSPPFAGRSAGKTAEAFTQTWAYRRLFRPLSVDLFPYRYPLLASVVLLDAIIHPLGWAQTLVYIVITAYVVGVGGDNEPDEEGATDAQS